MDSLMGCGHYSEAEFSFCRECVKERNYGFLENFSKKEKKTPLKFQSGFRVVNQKENFEGSIIHRNWDAKCRIKKVDLYEDTEVSSFTPEDIASLKDKQNNSCLCCFNSFDEVPFEIDHIRPVYYGGGNGLNNLQLLCRSCNFSKKDRHNETWLSRKRYEQVIDFLAEVREEESYLN